MTNATPAKLRDGSWGARIQGAVSVGDVVKITTKAGKSWEARVSSVVWSGEGVTLVATASLDRAPRHGRMGYGHGAAAAMPGYSRYCTASASCRCYDCAS